MSKVVHSKEFALQEMRKGIDIVAEAVGNTIGPRGTNVFLDDPTSPKFTNDGGSIAHVIQLEDKLQNAGAWVARNACAQTNDDAGDGTTTTVVVLKATIDEAMARPENKTQVMQSLLEAKDKAITLLKKSAKPITQKEVINVARISAENEELAQLVTEVVGKVGPKAVITIEDRKDGFESDYKIVQGYEAHVGFISPYFRNDPQKARAMYEDIPVLCTAKKLSNIQDLKFFKQLADEGINRLVIVAEDMEESVKGMFVATQLAGSMSLLVIKAQGPLLEDIASSVGATLIGDATGVTFENFDVKKHLGLAQRVVCEEKRTVFTSNAKSAKLHAERLEAWANDNPNTLEQRKLRERAAKLKGGVAVIRIGAHTDAERNYLKDKAEDTVHSVQSALEEGVVLGGGMALYRVAESMSGVQKSSIGESILVKALKSPLKRIVENAGKDYAEVIAGLANAHTLTPIFSSSFTKKEAVEFAKTIQSGGVIEIPSGRLDEVKNIKSGQDIGYNAKTDKYEDFFKTGVLDPLKVERCVLENAITTAAHFITTHSAIVDYTEPKTN